MRLPSSAAVYVRQSLDRAEGASIQRQIEDTQKLAHSLGWTIGEVYEDNDVSAYNRRKKRPSWTRMLDDLRSGKHDGVIFYDLDRMARQPRDLEDLIDILEQHKIPNSIVTGESESEYRRRNLDGSNAGQHGKQVF
ncbi:recombinase family protein [Rhodococcus sp. (in: high G+C Gram-positive bacteria)]|uniref:recombinase family protein n=1 Tax=Rhodococcus sp. TaxID=1831 RepID=UPI001A1EF2B0|nr:recombinase family protein [Rhodococcus sp. (in: high G+C Gram-positive bacteria)]MBJ7479697.1 recombinase family protein [Rhodococcus sp. (in: high G+C Gram-positive bacteria)]